MEAANRLERKQVQLQHLQAYDNSIVSLKRQVEDLEGQDMRDVIQDRVGACWGCTEAGWEAGGCAAG
jgi:hypothetical protein